MRILRPSSHPTAAFQKRTCLQRCVRAPLCPLHCHRQMSLALSKLFKKILFIFIILFFKRFIYLLLERGEGREKEGEKHPCVVASHMPPTGDLACNPGTCPHWESNRQYFGSQAGTQSPGLFFFLFLNFRARGREGERKERKH